MAILIRRPTYLETQSRDESPIFLQKAAILY